MGYPKDIVNMPEIEKKRESGIELLRILAMCGVVLLHINQIAIKDVVVGSEKYYFLYVLESIGICAVDLFLMISGFFLCATQKRSLQKPIELIIQVIIFAQANFLIRVIIGQIHFSFRTFFSYMVPANYFVLLYVVTYLFSPLLNIIFKSFNKKQWDTFLILALFVFSIWNTVVDSSQELVGVEWFGLSTIGAKGNQSGMNVVNFLLMYSVGAYFRMRGFPVFFQKRINVFVVWVICVFCITIWALFWPNHLGIGLRSALVYHNPLVILSAVLLLNLFLSFKFYSSFINHLSRATFTCYLFHIRIVNDVYSKAIVDKSNFILLVYLISVVFGIFIASYIIFKVYSVLVTPLLALLSRITILNKPLFDSQYPPSN